MGWRESRERQRAEGRVYRDTRVGFKNKAEDAVFKRLVGQGFRVTKRGWPDFFAVRGEEVILVEVKREGRGGPRVSPAQSVILAALHRHFDVRVATVGPQGRVQFFDFGQG